MKTNINFLSYLAHFFLECEILQSKLVEEIKTHILCSKTLFFENRTVYEIMSRQYCRAQQATDDNMAHAHCTLDTQGYKHTHSGCVILIAFPLQQWLHESAAMLRYTYIACLALVQINVTNTSTSHISFFSFKNILKILIMRFQSVKLNSENVIIPKEIRVPAVMCFNLKPLLILREKTILHHSNKPMCWCNQL